ncbi:hypothetical protein [Haloferax volcanii]|uniref:hypothetical protein n=1 Tax=Haloferax volcanii TaxID=2246 RepID=UPI0009FF2BA1|nr:hypothetical protein [Haloferax lucentense]
MGWISDLISPNATELDDFRQEREEKYPRHTYGPGYPIVIRRQELDDLFRLLEIESEAPDGWDNTPFVSREKFDEIIEESLDGVADGVPSPEERRDEIHKILELWQKQLTRSEDAVWTTIGIDYRFKFYIDRCELRADLEDGDFEEPDELDTAREILDRIETAHNTDWKLAIVHKRDLPLQEPEEDTPETR